MGDGVRMGDSRDSQARTCRVRSGSRPGGNRDGSPNKQGHSLPGQRMRHVGQLRKITRQAETLRVRRGHRADSRLGVGSDPQQVPREHLLTE